MISHSTNKMLNNVYGRHHPAVEYYLYFTLGSNLRTILIYPKNWNDYLECLSHSLEKNYLIRSRRVTKGADLENGYVASQEKWSLKAPISPPESATASVGFIDYSKILLNSPIFIIYSVSLFPVINTNSNSSFSSITSNEITYRAL